ncbi:MAG: Serpin (serine protease inhibitor) [Methanoregulaceae archaeon PtaB.Bin056]|nr:MAG: Serpin (serine protease inhibitor) [Methanoregulaceae archaeon PtaB.Bin056]
MHRTAIPLLGALSVLAILLAGCTAPAWPGPSIAGETPAPRPTITQSSPPLGAVVDANNRFAFDLFNSLADDPEYGKGNIFFSPYSISTALAITYEGAREETADEIRSVFHFPDNRAILRSGYVNLIAHINGQADAFTLRTANALWAEKTHTFLPDYISTAERNYVAKTTNMDFIHQPEGSRLTINSWVEDQTEDRIKDLIPPGEINPSTALVITNAIYFKGTWVKQFDPSLTRDADFMAGSGTTIRVPMMQRTDDAAISGYAETDTFQVLEMPYDSGDGAELSMLVILPGENDTAGIAQSLDSGTLQEIRKSLAYKTVRVYFPKFTMETKYFLPRTLSAMGMPTAFTAGADFSGMDGGRDLFITNIIHQAFVDLNEEGTEAAAATAVIMGKGAAPPEDNVPVFRADHPFIFFIQERETGSILFMGRVSEPV